MIIEANAMGSNTCKGVTSLKMKSKMLIEKERSTKDLVKTMFEINEKIQNDKNKEIVYTAMELILNKKIGTEMTNKIMEKIIGKGSDNMLAAEQMVLEENEMLINEGKRIGINEGKRIGINEGKRISVINMLKKGYPIETISQITEL